MRNIFLLLSCLLCLQACNEEKEVDWTPDVLTVSCNETLEDAGDGHWKVTLPTEYKGAVKLEIQTDKAWNVEVNYMTNEEEKWITPSAEGSEGAASLSLAIADNATAKDRKAYVVITTKGNIPVKKTITIVQGNVNEVLTIGTVDKALFPQDVFVTENAEGILTVTLPKDFTEADEQPLNILTYQGSASPVVDIAFPDEENQGWVVLTEALAVPTSESEVKTMALTIKKNTTNVYREALVNFTSIAGDLTVKRTVKVVQYGIERVIWNEEYCQQDREFIVSADANDKLFVATCENVNPADLEVSGGNAWLELTLEENKVYAKILANESTNTEPASVIVVKNKKTGTEMKMPIKQSMKGYGIVLGKKLWDLMYSDNIASQHNKPEVIRIFDDIWTPAKSSSKHVEFNQGGGDNPYVLTFDLGENSREYTSFGIMPRLQWTNPAPSTVKIEVSDDSNSWQTVVEKVKDNGFTDKEVRGGVVNGSYNDHYEGIIHWFELGKQQKRYIRLTVYETLTGKNGKGNYVFCLDEVFVSDRSNVQQ